MVAKRCQVALQLEQVTNLKPIRQGCAKDVENFADVLDIAVANLKEADRIEELGNGLLYATLLKKMTEPMIAQFNRWIKERDMQESVVTLREWVLQEAEYQTIASETVHGLLGKKSGQSKSVTLVSNTASGCVCFGNQHALWACKVFKGLSGDERWNFAKQHKLCFRCLGQFHLGSQCKFIKQCGIDGCKRTHNRLLHDTTVNRSQLRNKTSKPSTDEDLIPEASGNASSESYSQSVTKERAHTTVPVPETSLTALRTVPVVLRYGKRSMCVNALLDDASSRSYINDDVAAELGLQGTQQHVSVSVLNGKTDTFVTKPVEFGVESLDGKVNIQMSALTINRVTGDLKVIDWQKHRNKWNHLRGIRFPTIARHPVVDLLIGIDYLQLHQSYQDVCGRPGEPIARRTPLGWTCIGNVGHDDGQPSYCALTYYTHSPNSELSDLVKSFWDVEEVKNTSQIIKPCDKRALCKAEESLVYHHGRYQVGIPWKEEAPSLSNNYDMAYRRLVSTEKKLSKDPTVAQDYDSTLSQYLEKGYINKVTVEHKSTDVWYLPHFPVMRPDKSTTKVRIVFDALAKYGNASLNDAIDPGPKLQTELFDVLLRFRKSPVAIICDIAEMFLQVEMDPRDRPFHRFLWRSMSPDVPPDVYEFNRLVFGNTASPFLAQFVSQENAKKHEAELPKAAETVMKSTYMDDSMDSVETDDDGLDLYCQLKQLWSKASMHPRKWLSNSLKVLAHIPQSDHASKIDIREGSLPSVKALGLMWVPEDDIFRFKAEPLPTAETTKRGFLRQVARLFDPHGFLGPFIVTAKILLQNLWLTGHDWDDNLPEHLQDKITEWLGQWKDIETLEIPRCLHTSSGAQTTCIHTFVDASEDAYGTSVFAVYTYQNGDRSSWLVAAKNRVSPLKACSIPRLELMAAVLGLRLISGIVKVLQIEMDSVIFWSDSMNVLCWIRNNSRTFKPFVANRDEEEWPFDKSLSFYETDDQEKKSRKTIVAYTVMANADPEWRLEPTRFSCWKKLTRTCAWVNRFLYNCSNPADLRMIGELSREELNDAEIKLVAQAQQEAFPGEYSALSSGKPMPNSSKLQALHPQIDETGVMRLSGRLRDAECLPFAARFPIILPGRNWITKLVIKHAHEEGHHVSGTNRTLAVLSSKYWIVSAREAIRE
ncbi:uncharacterized protein LOC124151440 [Haliotis rufescens]|uniref:uncharacterized protein LOC124151440 n=1 Tax=Haliotis rufescens TaxID=6454 RepID=UPI00201F783A|nr:uncharacterized protein LOC124151440 [Haliotis rufescens]